MAARRRLVSYLLLNIFVSALVTGTIIYYYDRTHRPDCSTNLPDATAVRPGTGDVNVSIVGVIGAGTVADERVVIQNNGSEKLVLTGWNLKDNQGATYTFPQFPELMLYPGAKVEVYTKSGTDTLPNLYWGRASPVWISGELVTLYDPQNIPRAFYRVP